MDKKDILYDLLCTINDLIANENNLCEDFCKKNPTHRAERERDRDLIIFGMREVYIEMENKYKSKE